MTHRFPKTKAAVEKYDREMPKLDAEMFAATTNEAVMAANAKMEALGREVGVAFGEDTKEYNDPKTCADLVRPGTPKPPPGCEPTMVRRLLAEEAEKEKQEQLYEDGLKATIHRGRPDGA